MATISFHQNVVVKDKDLADEVKREIKSDSHACTDIPPATIDIEKQKEEAKKWCSLLKKS